VSSPHASGGLSSLGECGGIALPRSRWFTSAAPPRYAALGLLWISVISAKLARHALARQAKPPRAGLFAPLNVRQSRREADLTHALDWSQQLTTG
jgi:hypothetical protein